MTEQYIPIISGSETAKVGVSEVILIERDRRKLRIVTKEREYFYYEKLENVETLLDSRFYPCLKGCYINFERVSHMSDQKIYFDNGYVYNVGRNNFIKTKQYYKNYLKKYIKTQRK